ncbi:MAG: dcd2, partial [Parachlamydiales bacterium]|nr:dcd2 [Parachlamydiales bacterium]
VPSRSQALCLAKTRSQRRSTQKYDRQFMQLDTRSSVARLGMFINLSAPLGDIGFIGCWTLQLFALHPIRVYEGMRIGQMMFWHPSGKRMIYDGKYQGAKGPMASQIYKDTQTLQEKSR